MQRNLAHSPDSTAELRRWEHGLGKTGAKGHSPLEHDKPIVQWLIPEEESDWLTVSRAAATRAGFSRAWQIPVIRPNEPIFEATKCQVPESSPSLKNSFSSRVSEVPGVREIYHREDEDGGVNFWVIGEEIEREHKFDIYDIEAETMEKFPKEDLDFRVISLPPGQNPSEIPSDAELVYST